MVFSSLPFLFLIFPFFLAALLCGSFFKNAAFRNCSVLIISLFFYIWEESTNTLILIAICLINYYGASYLANEKHGKKIFIALIALNLLLLFIFKYSLWCLSFVTDRFIDKNIMLLGISFFIFHAISYLADVHTKKIQASKNLLDFSTYFCMFPHLVAGPIVRYAQIKDDIRAYRASKELFSFGMYRFLLGLNKKIIIANSVSILADFTFSATSPKVFSFMDAWTGIIAYGLQIYFDFSAYSDMAVGLAAMAGFRFEENFNRPYISTSVREFWRRWHISLSTWLRDYLYIPLGGSKSVHAYITYRNLFLVFLLCGIWHGANTTFVVWGLWHGIFICLERLWLEKKLNALPAFFRHAYLILIILLGWVFFKAENLPYALEYFSALFNFTSFSFSFASETFPLIMLAIGTVICFLPQKYIVVPTSHTPANFKLRHLIFQFLLGCFAISLLLSSSRNPFIYFNF